jgi:hypothetical protein
MMKTFKLLVFTLVGMLFLAISCTRVAPTPSIVTPVTTTTSPSTITGTTSPPIPPANTPVPTIQVVTSSVVLQEGNSLIKTRLKTEDSSKLQDNKMGTESTSDKLSYSNNNYLQPLGFKWARMSFTKDPLNWQYVEVQLGQYVIDPAVDKQITSFSNSGINIILNLGVGTGENRPDISKFKSDTDIKNYCNFVAFMVQHFKGRIHYYEIWNEPDTDTSWGGIGAIQYANLIKAVAPVIRQEDPDAKIVIGAIAGYMVTNFPGYGTYSRTVFHIEYLKTLLQSGVSPLIDVISWHLFYGTKPDDPLYQNYPKMIQEIKELATAQGFKGEYLVEELTWRTNVDQWLPSFIRPDTDIVATKYFLRVIIMNRGLGINADMCPPDQPVLSATRYPALSNLCNVMAGAEPASSPIIIKSQATNIKSYIFSVSNGDKLIALYTDGIGVDNDPGVEATLTISNYPAKRIIGIDVLNSFEQQVTANITGGNTVISNLLIKDYPIILRITNNAP